MTSSAANSPRYAGYARWLCALIVLCNVTACSSPKKKKVAADASSKRPGGKFEVRRIAHAGGGIDGTTYTNSYEALNLNLKKGFRYFEIDFVFTSDGELVCLHDWGKSFARSFGFKTRERPSLQTFIFLARYASRYEKCTLTGLGRWMREHPQATLITDIKEQNIRALKKVAKVIPNAGRRVIPQVYYSRNFERIAALGYRSLIWTLYRYGGSDADVLRWASKLSPPFAITMPKKRAEAGFAKLLQRKGIVTYAHTINDAQEAKKLMGELGVSEIYTDFLRPPP